MCEITHKYINRILISILIIVIGGVFSAFYAKLLSIEADILQIRKEMVTPETIRLMVLYEIYEYNNKKGTEK